MDSIMKLQSDLHRTFSDFLNGESLLNMSKFLFFKRHSNYFSKFEIPDIDDFVGTKKAILRYSTLKYVTSHQYCSMLLVMFSDFKKYLNKLNFNGSVVTLKPKYFYENNKPEKRYSTVLDKMQLYYERYLKNYITDFLIQGSFSTMDYIPGWSDLDIMLFLDTSKLNVSSLTYLHNKLIKLRSYLHRIDPLQHHGFLFVADYELKRYSQGFMPLETIKLSTSFNPRKLTFNVIGVNEDNSYLFNYLDSVILNPSKLNSAYRWKVFYHVVMLLPAIYLSKKGIYCYKKDSFKLAKKDFSSESWKCIDLLTNLRSEWSINDSFFRFFTFIKNPFLLILLSKFLIRLPKKYKNLNSEILKSSSLLLNEIKRVL